MTTIHSDEVRIPRSAREAVARHEPVVVLNRDREAFVIVHPEVHARFEQRRRGRRAREVLELLAVLPSGDPRFVKDMELVRALSGPVPEDPWARS